MKRSACVLFTGLIALGGATACADAQNDSSEPVAEAPAIITTARAELINRDRAVVGEAMLRQGPAGVLIRVEAEGFPPFEEGWHGIHLHMIGDCSNEDFTSSGGHINPSGRAHGLLHPDGPDNADLPNIYIHADGVMRGEFLTSRVSLNGSEDTPALFDADGSALVFHQNPDDHFSQPIGGAGPRIVCGVIEAVAEQ
ncbi:MAG: superoxide dismutase family protein [Pseudomonadota bacterium]